MILFWQSDVLGWCSEGFLVGAASGWRVKALLSLTGSRFNPRLGFMSMLNDTTASHTPDCAARQFAWACVCVCVRVSPQGWHETSCWVLWCAWWQMLTPPLFSTLFAWCILCWHSSTGLQAARYTQTYRRRSARADDAAISRCVQTVRLGLAFGQYFDKFHTYSDSVGCSVH